MEQERDYEMSDGEMMDTDDETEKVVEQGSDPKSTIFYKADKNGLMLKELDKIDAVKLEERAKRFGINLSGSRLVTQKQIDELYKNFGIESGNERHFRFDALHLNGVHGLTTKDIFEYLQDYKPVSLEWVDENSCNVICQDHISVALALLVHSREIISEEIKDMISKRSSYHWREGMPHPLVDMIFMRFATNSDKKNPKKIPEQKLKSRVFERMDVNEQTKNPWGDLCQSWGVYDHQEIFQRRLINNKEESFETHSDEERPYKPIKIKNEKLAKRLGKRNHIPSDEIDSDSDSEWKSKSKTPRMRMHADDEESKIKKNSQVEKNDEDDDDDDEREFAPLSIEVLNKKSIFRPRESKVLSEKFKRTPQQTTASIQSRLGVKVATDADLSSEDSLSDSNHNVMSRVQKVKKGQSNSVWSRLEVKASNSTEHNDLRQMLKTKKNKSNEMTSLKSNDLRKRLGKPKTNLRIEINNS